MMVRLDVTVAGSAIADGLLDGLPVGANQIVYIDPSNINFVGVASVSGTITSSVCSI